MVRFLDRQCGVYSHSFLELCLCVFIAEERASSLLMATAKPPTGDGSTATACGQHGVVLSNCAYILTLSNMGGVSLCEMAGMQCASQQQNSSNPQWSYHGTRSVASAACQHDV